MLIQAALLIFAFMALGALVVDLGIVRSTQLSLRTAAEAAALEGLFQRDELPDDARRVAASQAAALVFDEDADLTTGPDRLLLGAGPILDTGVAGSDAPAGGLLTAGGPYVPALELNLVNATEGDLVAGSYTEVDPIDPGNPDWHAESSEYLRNDFTPADAGDAPTSPAFLARLRRTNDTLGLDQQPGVSSSGPPLPFLFGLGSPLGAVDGAAYDPRRDGLTVRAVAIADAQPVLAAGLQRDDLDLEGLLPVGADLVGLGRVRILAFEDTDTSWRALAANGGFTVSVNPDGAVLGDLVGHAQPLSSLLAVGDAALTEPEVGALLLPDPTDLASLVGPAYVALYVPLVTDPTDPTDPPDPTDPTAPVARITGFASVRVLTAQRDPGGEPSLELTGVKLASRVAVENASAHPTLAAVATALLDDDPQRQQLLMAPALVR